MLHQHKQLAVILEATLGLLDAPARTALQFAALLPPDSVPWPWLKTLVTARHPELVQFAPDEPDPWVATHRRLEGLRLLTPGDHRELARLHRLVAAHLQAGAAVPPANQSLLTELEQHLAARAWAIYRAPMLSELWELEVLLAVLPGFSARREVSRDLVNATVFLSEKVVGYRSLREAMSLVRPAHESLQRLAAADPSNAGWQRDLSVSNIKMGNILRAEGDLARALRAYSESRAVSQRLAAADASSALCQHDLWVSHLMVGDVLRVQGDLAGALRAYQQALVVMERLVAVDASSAEWQCGLGNSHDRIGNVLRVQGDLAGALAAYREALTVNQRLTAADPANANWQRSLSVSHNKLGDVLSAQGDSAGALLAYRESLAVSQRLVADDQSNARLQMDLSTFHARKGDVLRAQGNLAEALAAYRESLVRIHVSYVT
jgi:tetratricopeptide (TPR) repeat protein